MRKERRSGRGHSPKEGRASIGSQAPMPRAAGHAGAVRLPCDEILPCNDHSNDTQ